MTTMAMSIPQAQPKKKEAAMDGYMTVTQAAERFSVQRKTIIRWIEAGHFPGSMRLNPRMPRSPYRIPEVAVNELLADRKSPPEPEG